MSCLRIKAAATAATLVLAPLGVVVGSAGAADAAGKKYANCTALTKTFKHGVAKSPAAAAKQVRQGYGRPATGKRAKAVYWANYRSMDRDKDGTACER